MKARIENGIIVKYSKLPSKFNSKHGFVLGGYEKLDPSIHKNDGFYDLITPEYDNDLQYLGNIYFNEEYEYFTYYIINKDLSLELEKQKKIQELKKLSNEKFQETDWYYIRKMRNGIEIPENIKIVSEQLYNLINDIEEEINNINNIKDVINYQINLDI